jgi:hypothetical protein
MMFNRKVPTFFDSISEINVPEIPKMNADNK